MKYFALIAYYFTFFINNGFSTFLPKYYAEIGFSDSQIGTILSLPSIVAMCFTPILGVLSDRVPSKRYLLAIELFLMAIACFLAPTCSTFISLLLCVSLMNIFSISATPTVTDISMLYCKETGKAYGPIRLSGSLGYEFALLLVGILMKDRLNKLYPYMGSAVALSIVFVMFIPNIRGEQHRQSKVPLTHIFQDKHVLFMYILILFSTITSQFYMAFFTKHLGDLGMSNQMISIISLISILPEFPYLFFADKIQKRFNTWNLILIGMLLNGLRWLGMAFFRAPLPLIICQIPAVTVMACWEVGPAFYLARRVPKEQTGTAQSLLTVTSFGVAKIIGGFLGGLICEHTGIPAIFCVNGILMLAGFALFFRPTRKIIAQESV